MLLFVFPCIPLHFLVFSGLGASWLSVSFTWTLVIKLVISQQGGGGTGVLAAAVTYVAYVGKRTHVIYISNNFK